VYLPAQAWLLAFGLTVVVEVPIVTWLLRGRDPGGWRLALLVVFANLATHPAVWFVFPQLFYAGTVEYLAAAETWAIVVEAVFYGLTVRPMTPARAVGIALAANGASFLVGLAVTELWPAAFY
jgi:hypothetical protein